MAGMVAATLDLEENENFLKEVVRVLKPSSHFLFTDFRPSNELESFNKVINDYFDVCLEEEIICKIKIKYYAFYLFQSKTDIP